MSGLIHESIYHDSDQRPPNVHRSSNYLEIIIGDDLKREETGAHRRSFIIRATKSSLIDTASR